MLGMSLCWLQMSSWQSIEPIRRVFAIRFFLSVWCGCFSLQAFAQITFARLEKKEPVFCDRFLGNQGKCNRSGKLFSFCLPCVLQKQVALSRIHAKRRPVRRRHAISMLRLIVSCSPRSYLGSEEAHAMLLYCVTGLALTKRT